MVKLISALTSTAEMIAMYEVNYEKILACFEREENIEKLLDILVEMGILDEYGSEEDPELRLSEEAQKYLEQCGILNGEIDSEEQINANLLKMVEFFGSFTDYEFSDEILITLAMMLRLIIDPILEENKKLDSLEANK